MKLPDAYAWLLKEPELPKWTRALVADYGLEFQHAPPPSLIHDFEVEIGAVSNGYYAWCGLTLAVMFKRAGSTPPSIPLRAVSWLNFGVPIVNPQLGDVMVFTWKSGDDMGGSHVTTYVGEDENDYHCLGGNQSHCLDIARFPKTQLHAARHPAGTPLLGRRYLGSNGRLTLTS